MARPLPTTKAQVSGHKFLRRRVEHGLVLGNIRMIHDPLARRRKALLFGGVGVAFLAVGSGMLAWLQPSPQPGDAPIVRSQQGQLFVDVNDTYHPVFNLASARIIAGQAAEAQTIGDEHLQEALLGSPVGIADAPGYLATEGESPQRRWTACLAGKDEAPAAESPTSIGGQQVASQEVIVLAEPEQEGLGQERAALVDSEGTQWLITQEGRVALPDPSTTEGRVVRRAVGVDDSTHTWPVPPELLNAFAELPPLSFPEEPPEVIDTGQGLWARTAEGVAELTPTQAEMLTGLGAKESAALPQEVAALADAPLNLNLPSAAFRFLNPDDGWMCAGNEGGGVVVPVQAGTVALAGKAVAHRFGGLNAGGVGVDSGHGYHVVSPTGQRHEVKDKETLEALGTGVGAQVPWEILRLLPEGSALSRDQALQVSS
ncbi:type VII secretion protein EccB [Corynebacterium sp. c8Ua_181]|uniref:Type VII secretion protein EccB n=1 Tax=Corynebacterium curieae TaxID=2913500 RepID=A0A9X3MAN6_9CORY|nr:type VII secretion protein EccB [Corynebacterium curieae]MCZ9307260.1 type VII secretion protein EccB [Corynebacterium curieae]MDV2424820.1 type VII secretion protein EccB [Corynebacterium curieae]